MLRYNVPIVLLISMVASPVPAADPPPASAPKPVAATREEMKALLEAHKKARPRLPMPPTDPNNPLAGVNNGRFRAYYIPTDLRGESGGSGRREPDPAMTLDNIFKVELFWITSRTNNCYYCMGHQELKLRAANLTDDQIAALDGDWKEFPVNKRTAFAFTRKLTFTPHLINSADIKELIAQYNPTQALEIVVTVAGYNSTNRWTDGLNIPAEESGERFKKEGIKDDFKKFTTPTSPKYSNQSSLVGPIPVNSAKACPPQVPTRPALESREVVETKWKAARIRSAVLPMVDVSAAKEFWSNGPAPNWVRLLATFPKTGKGRIAAMKAGMEKGSLTPRLKAAIAWASAREDRAWYALAIARERLQTAGLSDEQVFAIDADKNDLPNREKLAVAFTRKLTTSGALVTDMDVEALRKVFSDREVAEIVHHVCNAAFFNRVTEAASLPLDK